MTARAARVGGLCALMLGCSGSGTPPAASSGTEIRSCTEARVTGSGCSEESFELAAATPLGPSGADLVRLLGGEQRVPFRGGEGGPDSVLARLGQPEPRANVDVLGIGFVPEAHSLVRKCAAGTWQESTTLVVPGELRVTLPSGEQQRMPAELGGGPGGGVALHSVADEACPLPSLALSKQGERVDVMYAFGAKPTSRWTSACAPTLADEVRRELALPLEAFAGTYPRSHIECVVSTGQERLAFSSERGFELRLRPRDVASCGLDPGGFEVDVGTVRFSTFGRVVAADGGALELPGVASDAFPVPVELLSVVPCAAGERHRFELLALLSLVNGRPELESATLSWSLSCQDSDVVCELLE